MKERFYVLIIVCQKSRKQNHVLSVKIMKVFTFHRNFH